MFSDSITYERDVLTQADNTVIPPGSQEKVVKTMTLNMADIAYRPPQ